MIGSRLWQIAGWTMLHYFWVGAAMGVVALLAKRRLRRAAASVRYLAALGCLLLLSAAPVAIGFVVTQNMPPVARDVPASVELAGLAEPIPVEQSRLAAPVDARARAAAAETTPTWSNERLLAALNLAATGLPWLWVCGAPLSFMLTAAGLLGAERLRRQSRPLEDARISEMCRRLAASLRVSCRVGVAVCDRIAAPILVGVLRPMILLPAAALAGWDPQQLEMVLLHELAHVRRYDNLVNLLQRIVESLLFFQPMVWVVSGWVRREREHCCDELVVARTRQPHAYAEMLVTLAEKFSGDPRSSSLVHPEAFSAMADRPLAARIRRILRKEEQAMQVSRKAVGLVLGTALVVAVMLGGYYCLPSRAEDSSAEANDPAAAKPLVPGDVIEGVVVDEQGRPQPGIDVWTGDWREGTSAAKSGAEGRFRLNFPGPLIGEFNLLASNAKGTRQGFLTAKKPGASKLPLQQVTLKESRTLEAQVVDAGGRPVVGATAEICLVGGTACHTVPEPVKTDAQGRASLLVPADAELESIVAFKAGVGLDYSYPLVDRAKGQSPPQAVKLVLNGAVPISVRVQDSRGKPVAGLNVAPWQLCKKGRSDGVFCFRTARVGAVSDAQGRVQFDWAPADLEKWVQYSVDDGDYSYPLRTQLTIKEGGSRHLDVEILRPAQIAGKVRYADGKPAPGILIEAEGMGTGGNRFWAITAEDGTYRLKVQPDNSYIVAVTDDQWAAASLMGIVVKEGEVRDNLDLRLGKGTLIQGAISVDTDSWPSDKNEHGLTLKDMMHDPRLMQFGPEIPNEWKSSPGSALWGDGPDKHRVRLLRMASLDAAGRYAFRVGPGEYQLDLPGFPPMAKRLTVTNQSEIVVDSAFPRLPRPLRGIVVDRAGKPVPGAFVVYMGVSGSQIPSIAGKDGRFTLQRYQRSAGYAYAGSADAGLACLQAIAEDANEVTIVADKAATAVGRVVDAAGRPLAGMSVWCHFFPPQLPRRTIQASATTDKEGKYKLSALLPGWRGEMSFHRPTPKGLFELFKGPKVAVQSGENNLGDTIPQPVEQGASNTSQETGVKNRPPTSPADAKLSPGVKKVLAALDSPTTVEFIEKPFKEAVDYLAKQHGIKIQLDRGALGEVGIGMDVPVTRELKGVTLDSALRLMLGDLDLVHLIRDDGLLITTQGKGPQLVRQGAIDPSAYPMPNKAATMRKIADILAKKKGSSTFVDAPLGDCASFLADQYSVIIQLDIRSLSEAGLGPDVPVTMTVKDVSLDSALRQLLAKQGLKYVVRDEVILITTAEKPKPPALKLKGPADKKSGGSPSGKLVLAGLCQDEQGRAIADAQVSLFLCDEEANSHERVQSVRTDGAGRFRLQPVARLPDNESRKSYWVIAAAKGRATVLLDRRALRSRDPAQLQIAMPEAASLRGKITGPDGRPVEGAKVWTGFTQGKIDGVNTATSDAQGLFEIADLGKRDGKPVPVPGYPGAFSQFSPALFVQHPRFAGTFVSFSQVPGTVKVTLQAPAAIEGRVVYEDSEKPAAGVRLFAQPVSSPTQGIHAHGEAVTDSQGRYRFDSLGAGKYNVFLRDHKDDYTMEALDSFEAAAGATKTAPDLRLVHGALIVGRVLDADTGRPIRPTSADPAGHQPDITLYGPSRPRSGAACEAVAIQEDGTFRIRVPAGKNRVVLRHSQGRPMPGVNTFKMESSWEVVSPDALNLVVDEGETITVEFKIRKSPEASQAAAAPRVP